MSERLDRIEAILESTAQQQAENTAKIGKNADEIDTLLGACSTNEIAIRDLTSNVSKLTTATAESNQRFEVLRQESIVDRREMGQRFDDAVNQMNRDRADNRQNFDALISQMNRDRAAQQEIMQGLLLELTRANRRIEVLEQRAS